MFLCFFQIDNIAVAAFALPAVEKLVDQRKQIQIIPRVFRVSRQSCCSRHEQFIVCQFIGFPQNFESIEQSPATVTIRDRDTMQQERIAVSELADYFKKQFI